jgi:hypothetical protein
VAASKVLSGPKETKYKGDAKAFVEHVRQALYASKIVSYAQGFMLMREAARTYGWKLNFPAIALMWRGGCIIRRCAAKALPSFLLQIPFLLLQRLPGQHSRCLPKEPQPDQPAAGRLLSLGH